METFIEHSHISRLLMAVLPHINTEVRPLVSAVICFADLSVCNPGASLKRVRHLKTDDLFLCDKEVIFNCLRPVCNPNERRLIDIFQNIGTMKKFYEMYKMMSSLMPEGTNPFSDLGAFADFGTFANSENFSNKTFAGTDSENTAETSSEIPPENDTNADLIDSLSSMLTDEQKSTFEMLKNLFTG